MMAFMSGKSFHPKNQENQRKVFIAEQREKERAQKEKEKQRLLQQERNKESLFTSGTSKDPKLSQVGFMYQPPPGFVAAMEREKKEIEEDELRKQGNVTNAPTEGSYTKNVEFRPKPFGKQFTRRKCTRCNEIGHSANERECPLRNVYNPRDDDRKQMSDPLAVMKASKDDAHDGLVMKGHIMSQRHGGKAVPDFDLVPSDDEDIDVEEDILESLSKKDKKKLRKYLKRQAKKEEREQRRRRKEEERHRESRDADTQQALLKLSMGDAYEVKEDESIDRDQEWVEAELDREPERKAAVKDKDDGTDRRRRTSPLSPENRRSSPRRRSGAKRRRSRSRSRSRSHRHSRSGSYDKHRARRRRNDSRSRDRSPPRKSRRR